jgi:uncharacterized protein
MRCPICKKPVKEYDDPTSPNPFFPFCTERCKLIDLGRWLGERYHIPIKRDTETPENPLNSPNDDD